MRCRYVLGLSLMTSAQAGIVSWHAVEPAGEIGQRGPAVGGDQLQVRIAVDEARIDHARESERGVEHETDRRHQAEFVHVHLAHALRRGRMHQHRQRAASRSRPRPARSPDRSGHRPSILASTMTPTAPLRGCARELGLGVLRELPGATKRTSGYGRARRAAVRPSNR